MAEYRWNIPGTREVCSRYPKRFKMMDYKAMITPMASNLKLLSDASLKLVDALMYHWMIGSLM